MKWKTTAILLLLTVGIGAYISLYEIRQPLPEERERLSRQVMDLPLPSVSRLTIELPQARVALARNADGVNWRLEPMQVRADTELVQRILHHANPLTATRVLAGGDGVPLDLKAFGLEPALGQITWTAEGRSVTLLLGDQTPVGVNRYAKLADGSDVFIIPPALFDDANRPLQVFRDPRLLRFSTWAVDRITLTTPSATSELTRRGAAWRLAQPPIDEVESTAVEILLKNLVALRIQRYVAETPAVERMAEWGFDAPAVELVLGFQPPLGNRVTLFFGKPLPDDGSVVYAKRSDEPALYAVAKADVDALTELRFEAVTASAPESAPGPAAPAAPVSE